MSEILKICFVRIWYEDVASSALHSQMKFLCDGRNSFHYNSLGLPLPMVHSIIRTDVGRWRHWTAFILNSSLVWNQSRVRGHPLITYKSFQILYLLPLNAYMINGWPISMLIAGQRKKEMKFQSAIAQAFYFTRRNLFIQLGWWVGISIMTKCCVFHFPWGEAEGRFAGIDLHCIE